MPENFPVTVACPFCRQPKMTLYEALSEPWWCHCEACSASGSIVNVARKHWKLDSRSLIPAQIDDLTIPVGNNYAQQAAEEFWKSCTSNRFTDPELLSYAGLVEGNFDVRSRFQDFVGMATGEEVRSFAKSAGFTSERRLRKDKARYLVTRLFDLPGRIRGFLLANKLVSYQLVPRETGADGLFGQVKTFSGDIILCDSLPHVSRMYAAACREGTHCPVIGVHGRPDIRLIAHSLRGSVVSWAPDDVLRGVHLARQFGGRVCLTAPQEIANHTLLQKLAVIRRTALTWQEATYRLLTRNDHGLTTRLLSELDWSATERRQYLDASPDYIRKIVEAVAVPTRIRSVNFRNQIVCESPAGWHTKGGELISDAVIRLESIQHNSRGQAYYHAVISFQGVEHSCTVSADEADQRLLSWAHVWLRDVARVGLSHFSPDWDRRSTQLALRFHKPQLLAGTAGLGWNAELQQFQHAAFSLTIRGEVVAGDSIYQSGGETLPAPARLSNDVVRQFSQDSHRMRAIWAAIAAVGANVLAPAIGKPRPGILLVGETAWDSLASLCAQLGCPSWGTLTDRWRQPVWQVRDEVIGDNLWPGVLRTVWSQRWRQRLHDWTLSDTGALICQVDGEAAVGLLSRENWLAIAPGEPPVLDRDLRTAAGQILSSWLLSVCERRLCVATIGDYSEAVLEDMATWFERLGGAPETPRAALSVLVSQSRFATLLARLVRLKRKQGEVRSTARPSHTAVVPIADGVWIPELFFTQLSTTSRMGIDVDTHAVTSLLQAADAGYQHVILGHRGLVVKHDFWSENDLCGRREAIKRPSEASRTPHRSIPE